MGYFKVKPIQNSLLPMFYVYTVVCLLNIIKFQLIVVKVSMMLGLAVLVLSKLFVSNKFIKLCIEYMHINLAHLLCLKT